MLPTLSLVLAGVPVTTTLIFIYYIFLQGKVLIRKFFKKERIHNVLFQVYHAEWAEFETNRNEDKFKLNALAKLLNKMLTMNPNCRIAIEFVFADPFIYEIS